MTRTMVIGGLLHRSGAGKDTVPKVLAYQAWVVMLLRRRTWWALSGIYADHEVRL